MSKITASNCPITDFPLTLPQHNSQQARTLTAPRRWHLLIILTASLGLVNSSWLPSNPVLRDDIYSIGPITSIEAAQHAQQATVLAIPIPSQLENHEQLKELAALMPSLQASSPRSSFGRQATRHQNYAELSLNAPQQPLKQDQRPGSEVTGNRAEPIRILVVGDSMTQGAEGDYTWRYRMWQWIHEQNISATFVGPYIGTQQPDEPSLPIRPVFYNSSPQPIPPLRTSGKYAADTSPDFASNHFAIWGRAAAISKDLIQDIITNYPADLMLLMLGFNDMGWFYSDAPGTLASIQTLITNARAVNPNLEFAVANVPMRTDLGRIDLPVMTDEYNALLRDAALRWSTKESPVELVELRENYECELDGCPAGYDGLHPNTYGEYQIAHAFSLTLVDKFGLGRTPLTVPDISTIPARPMPIPANFKVESSPSGVLATWDPVFGAYGYDILVRIVNKTDWVAGHVASNRYDAIWTVEGERYEIKVRVSCGDSQKGNWTDIGSAVAHPKTPDAPGNAVVTATTAGFIVHFEPPVGPDANDVSEYQILYFDKDVRFPQLTSASFAVSPAHVSGLTSGHHYFVAISSWNNAGTGFPRIINSSVLIGEGTPSKLFAYIRQIRIW